MKKLTAYLLIVSVLWASVVTPAQAWLVPVITQMVPRILTYAGQHPLATSVAVHAAIAAITFPEGTGEPAADGSNVPLQIQLDPNIPLIKPASSIPGAIPATATPTTDTFPTTSSYRAEYPQVCTNQGGSQFSDWTTSRQAACDVAGAFMTCSGWSGATVVGSNMFCYKQKNGYWEAMGTTFVSTTACPVGYTRNAQNLCSKTTDTYSCPSGYTLSGQSCNPDTTTQVSDQKVQIQRTPSGFVQDPNDPDPLPENVTVTPDTVKVKTCGYDSSHPCPYSGVVAARDEVKVEPNGTVSYYHVEQKADGTTQENKVTASAPSGTTPGTVEVTGTSSSTYGSSGDSVGGSSGTATPSSNVNITGGTVEAKLDKTGLATDGKQCGYDAQHPCVIDAKPDATQTPTDVDGTGTVEGQIDDALGANRGYIDTIRDHAASGLTWSWLPDIPASSCTSTVIAAGGHQIALDICSIAVKIRDLAAYVFYVFTGFGLHRILTTPIGRPE